MKNITITTTENIISVEAAYNSEFVTAARQLGGKWRKPCWEFDIRDEDAVREKCLQIYGDDGITSDLIDIEITIPTDNWKVGGEQEPITLFGRTIARAFGRDSGARLGQEIVLVQGGFGSGGSMKNWRTIVKPNTIIIMRDVSRALVKKHDNDAFQIRILDTATNSINRAALEAERAKLLARIEQINGLLTATE